MIKYFCIRKGGKKTCSREFSLEPAPLVCDVGGPVGRVGLDWGLPER